MLSYVTMETMSGFSHFMLSQELIKSTEYELIMDMSLNPLKRTL